MYKEQFPVQFSVLSSRALEDMISSKYSIWIPFKCQFFTPGLNDIYIIKASEDIFYLRVSLNNWRKREELEAEIELLNKLHKCGISIAMPVQENEGSFLQEIVAPEGIRYAVLFTEAKGEKNDNPNHKQNYMLGSMVAQIHDCTDKISLIHNRYDIDFRHLIADPFEIVKPHMLHRLNDYNYLQDVGYQLKAIVNENLSRVKPEYGLCHGDIHHGNIPIRDSFTTSPSKSVLINLNHKISH